MSLPRWLQFLNNIYSRIGAPAGASVSADIVALDGVVDAGFLAGAKEASLVKGVFVKDQWCTPQSIIPSLAFTNAGGDKSFPSVVFPAGFLPAGVVVQVIHLIWYFTKKVDSSGAPNAFNAANKAIRVMKTGGTVGADDIVAMLLPNGGFSTAASGVEGGTIIEGTTDVKGEVDDIDNETYLVFCDQTTRFDCPTVTAASLTIYDIVAGLKVYYTVA